MITRLVRMFLYKVSGLVWLIERMLPSPNITLAGDRAVENSWIVAHMPAGPGTALDFGTGNSNIWLAAAIKGYEVTGVDLRTPHRFYDHSGIKFVRGDILDLDIPPNKFDLIINCSSVEHVGLAGRYGVTKTDNDGDLEVMKLLLQLVKPSGTMLLTIPIGKDSVFAPLHRVYGQDRLPSLLEGWDIMKEEYWNKNSQNIWTKVNKEVALSRKPLRELYGLGCFLMHPSK